MWELKCREWDDVDCTKVVQNNPTVLKTYRSLVCTKSFSRKKASEHFHRCHFSQLENNILVSGGRAGSIKMGFLLFLSVAVFDRQRQALRISISFLTVSIRGESCLLFHFQIQKHLVEPRRFSGTHIDSRRQLKMNGSYFAKLQIRPHYMTIILWFELLLLQFSIR